MFLCQISKIQDSISDGIKMGNNEKNSVVDKNLKINSTKNIFICGSSVFPVNGITNPTWTIMTLANRLAKFLSEDKK